MQHNHESGVVVVHPGSSYTCGYEGTVCCVGILVWPAPGANNEGVGQSSTYGGGGFGGWVGPKGGPK